MDFYGFLWISMDFYGFLGYFSHDFPQAAGCACWSWWKLSNACGRGWRIRGAGSRCGTPRRGGDPPGIPKKIPRGWWEMDDQHEFWKVFLEITWDWSQKRRCLPDFTTKFWDTKKRSSFRNNWDLSRKHWWMRMVDPVDPWRRCAIFLNVPPATGKRSIKKHGNFRFPSFYGIVLLGFCCWILIDVFPLPCLIPNELSIWNAEKHAGQFF